jgi:hypothetical protein
MLLQGKAFDGSSSLGAASHRLEAIAGSARWMTEYEPVTYAGRRLIETLLNILWGHDICCAISGLLGTYTAGMSSSYLHVALFIARSEHPLLVCLFQLAHTPTFSIGPLEFTHMGNIMSDQRFYTVTLGDTSLPLMVYPIDTIGQAIGNHCNFDFLNFVWDYMAEYSFLKFGILAFPVRNRTMILYVEHHRARSDGWQSTALCAPCARLRRDDWYVWYSCERTAECRCVVCVRQPPSLRASAAHVVFTMVLSPERFRVTRVTTFDHFVYAFNTDRVPMVQLLPPFGVFRMLAHRIDSAGGRYHLYHAPSCSTLLFPSTVTFDRMSDAVYALRWDRQRWWCATCDCPLFVCDQCFEITTHAHLGIV